MGEEDFLTAEPQRAQGGLGRERERERGNLPQRGKGCKGERGELGFLDVD